MEVDSLDPVALTAAAGELGVYVIALSAMVTAAIVFRHGFSAGWKALKAALRIGSSAATGK
jgi:hypothetical protein